MSGLLLDTVVVVRRLFNERAMIPDRVVAALEDGSSDVHLSAVNVWEIAIKR